MNSKTAGSDVEFGVGWGLSPDVPASLIPHDARMAPRRVLLHVDVTVDGPTISGELRAAGFDRPFSGRLGLIAAIEEALGAPDEPDRERSLGIAARNRSAGE